MEAETLDALRNWRAVKTPGGQDLVSIQGENGANASSGDRFDVRVDLNWGVPGAASSVLGSARCNESGSGYEATLWINKSLTHNSEPFYPFESAKPASELDDLWEVVVHEWGHILGLTHTGVVDAQTMSAMTTCLSSSERSLRKVDTDDDAALGHKKQPFSYESMTANQSFEKNNATKHWKKTNLATFATSTASPSPGDGPRHLQIKANSNSSKLYQVVNVAAAAGKKIDYRLNLKTFGSKGSVFTRVKYRTVDYDSTGPSTCEQSSTRWPTGENQNLIAPVVTSSGVTVRQKGPWKILGQKNFKVGSGSNEVDSSWGIFDLGSTLTLPSSEGTDLMFIVLPRSQSSSGSYVTTYVDNLRIRDRS